MTRTMMLASALALAIPSFALGTAATAQPAPAPADPSNPAGAPLSPTQDAVNQPARGEDSRAIREAQADAAMAGTASGDTESEADRQAREEAAKPKQTRTVRMGERTMAAGSLDSSPRR